MSKKKVSKRAKKKAKRRNFNHDPSIQNNHHIWFIGRFYDANHYSRLLRNYWYCQVYIPMNTLHKTIHNEITSVPIPSETTCRFLYNELLAMEKRGELSPKDNIVQRLQLLISLLNVQEVATASTLNKMLHIAKEFYAERPP